MTKVVDASVLVEYFSEGEHVEAAEQAVSPDHWICAPALIDAEVGQALRRQVRAEQMTAGKARVALEELLGLPIQRIPHGLLVERAWELRHNVTFYDGLYVALAEAMDVPLLTIDRKLARASGLRVEVELIAPV
jgi:predicted nucleic acid-binding protein